MKAIASLTFAVFCVASLSAQAQTAPATNQPRTTTMQPHPYVGMWITADGFIRHELLPNGRYDEARGNRKSAYQGRYVVKGNHIDYVDDTGFTADGEFIDGVLHHAGMVLKREEPQRK
ncbi:Atu4866 domain-containing protein [soil metagenome]